MYTHTCATILLTCSGAIVRPRGLGGVGGGGGGC